jgi:HK97 gp10 family phage protein
MTDAFEIRFTGGEELARALRAIPNRLAERVTRAALRNAANYMARNIRAAAPKKSGRLRKSIRVKTSSINRLGRNGVVGVYITVYPGKNRQDPKGAWYGKFVETGYNRGSKAVTGRQAVRMGIVTRAQLRQRTRRSGGSRNGVRYRHGGNHVEGQHFVINTFRRTGEQTARLAQAGIELAINQAAGQLGFRRA